MAREDLLDIVAYIAEDNPAAAYDVHAEVEHQVGQLAEHPELGRRGRIQGTRELVIRKFPYVVPYRVTSGAVEILRVYHTSRLWPTQLAELEGSDAPGERKKKTDEALVDVDAGRVIDNQTVLTWADGLSTTDDVKKP